jgi:predicted DsbA family dithiol-disulfide isomerase
LRTPTNLPAAELARVDEERILEGVLAEHNAAVKLGITGVPAVYVAGQTAFVVGAQPYDTYRRWADRLLAAA